MNRETKVMLGIGLVFVAIIVVIGFGIRSQSNPNQEPADASILIRSDSYSTGNPSAKVNLVEFGDYECPACGVAHPIIKQIVEEYASNPDFNFVFRNFPLSQHANARIAAEAAEAAGTQGKFWEMHNTLYEKQNEWAESDKPLDILVGYAESLGLDVAKFKQEVQDAKYNDTISSDYQDGITLGVTSTPTFYINGQASIGVSSYDSLKAKIEAELSK